jgi:hypothetical protein
MSTSQKSVTMPTLQQALDAESYEWLAGYSPVILSALEREVAGGRTPEQIKLFVLRQTGRIEIALRCEQVARHIESMTP